PVKRGRKHGVTPSVAGVLWDLAGGGAAVSPVFSWHSISGTSSRRPSLLAENPDRQRRRRTVGAASADGSNCDGNSDRIRAAFPRSLTHRQMLRPRCGVG